MNRTPALFFLPGIAAALAAAPAWAGPCEGDAPDLELATSPADGATDVPLDTKLWVLAGQGPRPEVELDGNVLTGEDAGGGWMRFDAVGLEANTSYDFRVFFPTGEGTSDGIEYGPYAFTTGNSSTEVPVTPAPGSLALSDGGGCADWLEAAQCVPEGEWAFAFADVDAPPGTALWHVRASGAVTLQEHWLPATCPPGAVVAVSTGTSPCLQVEAVGANGVASAATSFCGDSNPQDFWGDLFGLGSSGGSSSGPSPSGPSGSSPGRSDGPFGCRSGPMPPLVWSWLVVAALAGFASRAKPAGRLPKH